MDIKYKRHNCTERLWQLTQDSDVLRQENWTERVIVELKAFEMDLLKAMTNQGWDGTEDEKANQWTFSGALFYSIIVITTIGEYIVERDLFATMYTYHFSSHLS
jgi:hypothetical protein